MYPVDPSPRADLKRLFVAVAGAVLGPLMVYTIYILIGHLVLPLGAPWLDYLVAAVSIGTGITFVWRLPLGRWLRLVLAVAYLPLAFGGLVMYALAFVCFVYRECL